MPNYVSDLFKHTKLALIEINTHLILFFEKCFIIYNKIIEKKRASLVGQTLKNLPTIQETRVWFLGWDNPLEKGMATHSSILAWGIPWTEEPGGLHTVLGVAKSQTQLGD